MRTTPLLVVVSTGLAACGSFGAQEVHHEYVDQGIACLRGRPTALGQAYDENAPLKVEYWLDTCLSSSCTHDRAVSCAVTRDGSGIVIRTSATWTERGSTCTADCGHAQATCDLDGLPAGHYTVALGGRTLPLDIPSVADAPLCLESP